MHRQQGQAGLRRVTFSPKVFIPLTQLCRDVCGYCTFRRPPADLSQPYLSPEQVLEVARRGARLGCREALFVLGEKPEERYPQARRWLRERGCESSVEYLYRMCRLVLEETPLFPHSNPGNLDEGELRALREVNVSLGLMLENVSPRLRAPGGPHQFAPSKDPALRLATLEAAGRLKIPFTTGLLLGIGETWRERLESLRALRVLQERFGHLQEVILQNFRAKPRTPMRSAGEPDLPDLLRTVRAARRILGEGVKIQVPPNLALPLREGSLQALLEAGVQDWGGISPLTVDYVNPEAPWPRLAALRERMRELGFQLRARYPVHPEFFLGREDFVDPSLRSRLCGEADEEGLVPDEVWLSGCLSPVSPMGREKSW